MEHHSNGLKQFKRRRMRRLPATSSGQNSGAMGRCVKSSASFAPFGAQSIRVLVSAEIVEVNHEQHMLGFFADITERKRVENKLFRTLAREKELGQLRSNFVSMVSHEFRTPLGIIQSSAEILEDYLDQLEPPERRDIP